jgi:tryptophan synthase beta chain
MNPIKYLLSENQMPTAWYNIQADLPVALPPILNPGTGQPIGTADLAPLFPTSLIEQEMSQERWIEIPDEVRSIYQQWRPTPLYRARRLEQALDTPAKIYYKYEGVSPVLPTIPTARGVWALRLVRRWKLPFRMSQAMML